MIVIIAILDGTVNNSFSLKDRHGLQSRQEKNRVSDYPCIQPWSYSQQETAQMPDIWNPYGFPAAAIKLITVRIASHDAERKT